MSDRTAVYRLFAADDTLLYVGISRRFGNRWHQHAQVQPWWPEVHHQTITWYDTRQEADDAETAAIAAERPVHNVAKAQRTVTPRPDGSSRWATTTEVAAMIGMTRHTVEREIGRGNLRAEKFGGRWLIEDTDAERWVAQFRPYAGLRSHHAPAG